MEAKGTLKKVLVVGGAGYVGAVLVPALLKAGYQVRVLDLYLYGSDVFDAVKGNKNLEQVKGDMRDSSLLQEVIPGCDAIIHLACISNDPSFELDPALGKSINYDCFRPMVRIAKESGVKRFIYASSSSVYGVKEEEQVTEELPLEPLTDYSKYKAMCEEVLREELTPECTTLILRPSTVCGYSPRLRLDLTVNILTTQAYHRRNITVFGGAQMRPNIHIADMADAYVQALSWPHVKIHGETFNVGFENLSVMSIAETVKKIVGPDVTISIQPTNDNRSYRVSSQKIRRELGFSATHTLEEAVRDLLAAFQAGKVQNPFDNIRYYNIKTMQHLNLR